MPEEAAVDRRTVLTTTLAALFGSTGAAAVSARTAGAAPEDTPSGRGDPLAGNRAAPDPRSVRPAEAPSTQSTGGRTGVFDAAVDRIVDGDWVVILVESGGRVVDQVVVERGRLPAVEEGDRLRVLLVGGEFRRAWIQ